MKHFSLLYTVGMIPLLSVSCTSRNKVYTQPNILFIMSDDHSRNALSCYGGTIMQTTNLDRLAKEGMKFNQCMVTNSLSAPSRAVIITGKYSHLNSVKINETDVFDNTRENIGKLMQKAGYQTALFGKWHLWSLPTGFDSWKILDGQGKYYNPKLIVAGNDTINAKGYVTNIITDETINWLKNRDKSKPFFVMCHHKAPHVPHQADKKHIKDFQEDLPLPENFYDDFSEREEVYKGNLSWTSFDSINDFDMGGSPSPGLSKKEYKMWCYQNFFKGYFRVCESLDENIGKLLDYIDESGLKENTIVIYTSDNGFFLGEHGWYNKMWMYEESLHIPFLIRYPGVIKAGSVCNDFILNVDFAPTFLDFAGSIIPRDFQGVSFRKLLQGNTPANWRKSIYYRFYDHYCLPQYGIRTQKFKLICFPEIGKYEMFDLDKDPSEMKNVYHDSGYREEAGELKNELMELKKYYKDYE